jgi:hypothetical protein
MLEIAFPRVINHERCSPISFRVQGLDLAYDFFVTPIIQQGHYHDEEYGNNNQTYP